MSHLNIIKKHYSSIIVDEVSAICEPLKNYGINYFVYARCFDDGSLYTLISRRDVYFHHFKNQYNFTPFISEKTLNNKNFQYIPTSENSGNFNKAVHDFQDLFGIKYPIYLFERYKDYFDLFIYAVNNNHTEPLNFYLNNQELFNRFKFYFKDKAHKLINQSNENRIIVPVSMRPNFGGLNYQPFSESSPIDFFDKLIHKRYVLQGRLGDVSLTKRELEILKYIVEGYTFKETAKNIGLSPRTVESYLNNARLKLGMQTKAELTKILSENSLFF